MLARLGLADEVVFPGYVPAQELPWWYRAADLFVYPSVFEGFGLPVLEAMACGTPTITSTASALEDVAGDAALLVDPADSEALAEAIGRVLGDPATAEALRACRTVPGCPFSLRADGGCDSKLVRQRARRVATMRDFRRWMPWVTLVADALLINVAFIIAYWLRYDLQLFRSVDPANNVPYKVYWPLVLLLLVVLLLINRREGAMTCAGETRSFRRILWRYQCDHDEHHAPGGVGFLLPPPLLLPHHLHLRRHYDRGLC